MDSHRFAPTASPFWWQDAPCRNWNEKPLERRADVVVVGAGYTGLSAALTLARAGREVVVIDQLRPGEGASTRNGGITSGNLRPSPSTLRQRFGPERADAVLREAKEAREDLYQFIARERIDCDFRLSGRFAGALGSGEYETLARDVDHLRATLGIEAYAVPRQEQAATLGTDLYTGGAVRMDIGGLHPAKLFDALVSLALAADVRVHAATRVTSISEISDGWHVNTSRGTLATKTVLVATNGYCDGSDPWLRRRFVPVRSRIIATQELDKAVMTRLMPRLMMVSDTRKLSYYYRPSPDGRRILFGGRDAGGADGGPTEHLRQELVRVFPELEGVSLTHSWYGNVAMNRDMIPRIFSRKGLRYAGGCCGSGVVWARWMGNKVARQILEEDDGQTALAFRPPKAIPFFRGKPWFMPPLYGWMTLKDAISIRRARKETSGNV